MNKEHEVTAPTTLLKVYRPHINQVHSCPHCNDLLSKTSINEHLHDKHFNDNNKCPHCPETFVDIEKYTYHVTSVHQLALTKSLICPTCNAQLVSLKKYDKHCKTLANPTYQKMIVCDLCPKSYTSIHNFKKHMHTSHESVINQCNKCKMQFNNPDDFTKHLINSHAAKLSTGRYLFCSICYSQHSSDNKLYQHHQTMASTITKVQTAKKKSLAKEYARIKKVMNLNNYVHKFNEQSEKNQHTMSIDYSIKHQGIS